MKVRVEQRRQQGHSPAAIAQFVHKKCGPSWSKKILWTPEEREELERLDRVAAERNAEKTRMAAEAAEAAAQQAAGWRASLPPPPPNLGREGLSPTAVREALGCTLTELNRWADDGRLPADGQKFYYGVGPLGGSKWGRAWLAETVDNAAPLVDDWRARDKAEMVHPWTSEASLFELVKSRFPDAVSRWSAPWLGRQSVDIYIPSINVAIEYQGEQHYRPVPRFGGEDGFQDTQARDARKRERLASHGVALVEWRFDAPILTGELDRVLAHVNGRCGLT